jgi:S1-C subfamily serine protease
MKEKKIYYAIGIFIILLLAISTGNIYSYIVLNNNFNEKITSINKEVVENKQLNRELQNDLSMLRNNLTSETQYISNNVKNFQDRNQKEINALNSLISEIEKQSNIKLDEVKDELKNVQLRSKDFTAIIDDVVQSIVSVNTDKGQASGVIIDNRGFIVTNYHVVDTATKIRILTYDREVYGGILVGYDDSVDIAIIKIDANLKSLKFADSDKIKVGERVIALGNPAGLSFTVTEGIVSAIKRKGPNNRNIYIQTDVPINPGNSGGPLVNADGKIIGINNFKIGGYESLGFALESNVVKSVSEEIIEKY